MTVGLIGALLANLYISAMDKKEKGQDDEPYLQFLTPFSQNTPRIKRNFNSAAFLTPPYTGEGQLGESARKIPCFPRIDGAIPFDLPFATDEFSDEYKFDIVRELKDKAMVHTVCKKIFEYLDNVSLCRASHVCKTWHGIIRKEEPFSRDRVVNFITKKRKYCERKGKENVGLQKRSFAVVLAQNVLENTPESASKISIQTAELTKIQKLESQTSIFRPCPKCSSPAKVNDTNTATCSQCNERFCLSCFKKYDEHNVEACLNFKLNTNSTTPQKTKRNRKYITGTKGSKNRLRRLSSQKK